MGTKFRFGIGIIVRFRAVMERWAAWAGQPKEIHADSPANMRSFRFAGADGEQWFADMRDGGCRVGCAEGRNSPRRTPRTTKNARRFFTRRLDTSHPRSVGAEQM